MAQDFAMRYPLIDGQGNFGSMDGDPPAAMRYTEARLTEVAWALLEGIDENAVDFRDTYDAEESEPAVLPARFPNLLANGAAGIAVGMATSIPPHNIGELCGALGHLIKFPNVRFSKLMSLIPGPDFPTGATIMGREGIKSAYATGRGKLIIRAKGSIERQKNNRDSIIITELPYQVNKANLITAIAALVQGKKIDGITDIRDESDKDGIRVVIELRRDVEPQIILNYLYKHTQLETTFGVINLALVNSSPRVLNLKQILTLFIDHRRSIIRRRTQFDLDRALNRAHILEGLKIALDKIDQIIKTIRASKSTPEAKVALMKKFGLSEIQAQAILEMQLQRLTALERGKIEDEYKALLKDIEHYRSILGSEKMIEEIIKDELKQEEYEQIIIEIDRFRNMMFLEGILQNNQCFINIAYDLDVFICDNNFGVLQDVKERLDEIIQSKDNTCKAIHAKVEYNIFDKMKWDKHFREATNNYKDLKGWNSLKFKENIKNA
ncbi:hypothetical protein IH922_07140 [candidate division KSB1 bacterium]|nr:hypothetical protein [candidate division KSB1 bacterium]